MKYITLFILLSLLIVSGKTEEVEFEYNEKVKIDLFIEALCPYSMRLISGSFAQAIKYEDFFKIAEVNVIPFGNEIAIKTKTGEDKFFCQHGPQECKGNKLLACTLDKLPQQEAYDLMACIMNYGIPNFVRAGRRCSNRLEIEFSEVKECTNSEEGNNLIWEMKEKSRGVQYTPFIEVNGVHDRQIEKQVRANMIKYACENYDGEVEIDLCHDEAVLGVINI